MIKVGNYKFFKVNMVPTNYTNWFNRKKNIQMALDFLPPLSPKYMFILSVKKTVPINHPHLF
jgi:hypothetical protein